MAVGQGRSVSSVDLGGSGPRLENELASVITRHVEVNQDSSGAGRDDRGRHHLLVDTQDEEQYKCKCCKGEEEVIEERLEEGGILCDGVSQPQVGPKCCAGSYHHQHHAPACCGRLESCDHLCQSSFKRLQVFTCCLFKRHDQYTVRPKSLW